MQDLLTKTLVVLSSIAWTATPNFLFFWTLAMHYRCFFNISVLKFLEEFQLPKASSFIQMSLISTTNILKREDLCQFFEFFKYIGVKLQL